MCCALSIQFKYHYAGVLTERKTDNHSGRICGVRHSYDALVCVFVVETSEAEDQVLAHLPDHVLPSFVGLGICVGQTLAACGGLLDHVPFAQKL